MKKVVIIIVLATLVSSCAPKLYPSKREVITVVLDYRKYNDDGFFISSTPFIGAYEPLGDIKIVVFPGKYFVYKDVNIQKNTQGDVDLPFRKTLEVEKIQFDELLEIMVNEAKKLGADGLANMTIREESHTYTVDNVVKTEILYYNLSGLAIKRK